MKKILLTRLTEDNEEDKIYFQNKGYAVLECPLLELFPSTLNESFTETVAECEWVFLTSRHAADFFFKAMNTNHLIAESKKYAVIGEKTAKKVIEQGLSVSFQARQPSKRQLFSQWLAEHQQKTTIFYPKSNLADSEGETEFELAGHQLWTVVLYENRFRENQPQLLTMLKTEEIAAVFISSPSIWHRFFSAYTEAASFPMPRIYCLGKTTQRVINKDGYVAEIKNRKKPSQIID